MPALKAVRRAFPEAELTLAAPSWQEPLARLAGVDRVVDMPPLVAADAWQRCELCQTHLAPLRGADVAVNLHGRGPQSTRFLLATEPGWLVTFAHDDVPGSGVVDVAWRPGEHEVHRWTRLLTESGIPGDPGDRRFTGDLPGAPPVTGAVVVHPGAASAARRWPADRFGTVAAELAARGHDVVITGGPDEVELAARVRASAGAVGSRVRLLAGATDVATLAATVAAAELVVSNDTGVAHLATAFGVRSVVLFGPTPPSEWGPPPDGPHVSLWRGRRGDPGGAVLDPGLDAITVDDVMAAIDEVMAREPA